MVLVWRQRFCLLWCSSRGFSSPSVSPQKREANGAFRPVALSFPPARSTRRIAKGLPCPAGQGWRRSRHPCDPRSIRYSQAPLPPLALGLAWAEDEPCESEGCAFLSPHPLPGRKDSPHARPRAYTHTHEERHPPYKGVSLLDLDLDLDRRAREKRPLLAHCFHVTRKSP